MEQEIGYVYMITSPTGRLYVGSTINIGQRWNSYRLYKCKDQPKIYNSLKKYGYDNHIFEIVWQGNISEMLKYETLIGRGFDVLNPENLNCTLPKLGEIHSCVNEETKEKIGKAHKGKIVSEETKAKHRLSKQNMSQETKDKMSKSAKGKIITDKTKENMRIAQTGRKHSEETKKKMSEWQIGKKHSQETKDRISNKRKGKKWSEEHVDKISKPVLQYTIDNVFIKEWKSAKLAGKELSIDDSSISKCCNNKHKTAGKFKWSYKIN